MDDAWWGPSIPLTGGPWFALAERSRPRLHLVNARGERFVNESAPYVEAVHAMYGDGDGPGENIPTWLVFDQRYRNRYMFTGLGPRQPLPGRWFKAGIAAKAATLAELAEAIDVPPTRSTATVERFNGFARDGVDEDFHRGESAYDHYYGDPRNKPNPSLGPLDQAPYYAVKIVPGDLGTKGGLRTDDARPGAARRRLGDRRAVRGGQRQRRGDGPHLCGARRDHRPGDGLRLPCGAATSRPKNQTTGGKRVTH